VEATKLRFRKGDIIFGRRRVYQRKLAVAEFDGICSAHAMVLRPKTDVVLPEFLPFFMQSDLFMTRALEISVGSLSPTINWRTLAKQEFALPPLAEQWRIARVLGAARNVIEAYHTSIESGQSVLRSLQKKYFLEQPEGKRVKIGDVAEVKNGTTPRRKRKDYWLGDIPWLPTGKVNERFIRAADEFITKKALAECSLSIIPANSVLIAMIGQGLTRGKAARLEIDACINQNFGAVIPTERADSWFLFYQLETFYEYLRAWSHGTNQHALNCNIIREFPIWLPPIERQREIVIEFRNVDSAIQSSKKQLNLSDLLFASLQESALY
jgi:type I restriction enzyme S subunit